MDPFTGTGTLRLKTFWKIPRHSKVKPRDQDRIRAKGAKWLYR